MQHATLVIVSSLSISNFVEGRDLHLICIYYSVGGFYEIIFNVFLKERECI